MSDFGTYRTEEVSSPSSDEKMDTGSDTFHSQGSPNSDYDDAEHRDPQILRLTTPQLTNSQSPESEPVNPEYRTQNPVLRLSEPANDSLTSRMSNLNIDSPKPNPEKPTNLGTSTPRLSSALTLTTSHPLMGLGSPDYPDLIPKKNHKIEDEKDLSLSSIEDERIDTFYGPQRNTSKNNLYFTENFVTAESILTDSMDLPPDVARVKARRKMVSTLDGVSQRNLGRNFGGSKIECGLNIAAQSSPKVQMDDSEYHSVAEWCESPSQLRAMPNFELPIEMSSSIGIHNDLNSPDVVSSSTQEDASLFAALVDPYTGSVALRPRQSTGAVPDTRRKIQLPADDDGCSLDSLSDATLESEDEPIDPPGTRTDDMCEQCSDDDDDTKRSKSTNTISHSDTIPEYSAAEELSSERAWLRVGPHRAAIDMKVIEPYKRVVSHGGYSGGLAIVVFSACHLPDTSRADYTYVMNNLFLYVIYSLERLVTEEYILVYLHGSAHRRRLPTLPWLHECYKLIDRRLRKSLKHLYLVHPTFWLKSFVTFTKIFLSSKFFKKLSYVQSLDELMQKVPLEPNAIPDLVKEFDNKRKR